jgi:hypothetical protein
MNKEEIRKAILACTTNFLSEFIYMNKFHNNKVDENVIALVATIPDFDFYYLVKNKDDEELPELDDDFVFECMADFGWHYNLKMKSEMLDNKRAFKRLLKKKNLECIYIRPEYRKEFRRCNPLYWERIVFVFNNLGTY